ncbi:MAG: hypothetical protein JSR66_21730 [Proteobacteria bacterium]|nr:hypothetical protein [Pseudomonadota bacterium]
MKREYLVWLIVALGLAGLVTWVARNTYWTDEKVSLPPKGEAAVNPFYIREKFAAALGARPWWARRFKLPPAQGVAFVSMLNWDLMTDRREQFERWVESGGRLVVDGTLIGSTEVFEKWSGISRAARHTPKKKPTRFEDCKKLIEAGTHDSYIGCGTQSIQALESTRKLEWALRDENSDLDAARVRIGRGSVTVLTGAPFTGRTLFADDNGMLFVAATQLRRGDIVHFFAESDQDSLLELAWELGWPVICVLVAGLVLAIWRGSVRFGPMAPATQTARRSLAEQIRGTGRFTLRIGSGAALHAATARALNEVAARYINSYETLPGAERMQALEKATGFESSSLAAALQLSGPGRAEHMRADLELLEAARRRILLKHMRPRHGN